MLFWSLCPLKPIQNLWESRRVSYVFLLKTETPNAVLCSVWGRKQCLLEKSWMCASVLPWILPDPTFVDESNVEEFLVIFICPRTCCFSGSGKCCLFLLYLLCLFWFWDMQCTQTKCLVCLFISLFLLNWPLSVPTFDSSQFNSS